MQYQQPCITAVADQLPGQRVVLADGEDLGVVQSVIDTIRPDDGEEDHILAVQVNSEETGVPLGAVFVPERVVSFVTDEAVVLGTTAPWVAHHCLVEPPSETDPDTSA